MTIEKNRITFVIGKVGAGKSALVNSIMNEMENIFTDEQHKYSEFDSQIGPQDIKL